MNELEMTEIFNEFIEKTNKVKLYTEIKFKTWDDEFGEIELDELKKIDEDLFIYYNDYTEQLKFKSTYNFYGKEYLFRYKGYEYVSLPYLKPNNYTKQDRIFLMKECINVLLYLNSNKNDFYIYNILENFVNNKFEEKYSKVELINMVKHARKMLDKPNIKFKKVIINHELHLENDKKYNSLYVNRNWEEFIKYKRSLYMKYLSIENEKIIKKSYNKLLKINEYKKWKINDIKNELNKSGFDFALSTIKKYIKIKRTDELIKLCNKNNIYDLKDIAEKLEVSIWTIKNNKIVKNYNIKNNN